MCKVLLQIKDFLVVLFFAFLSLFSPFMHCQYFFLISFLGFIFLLYIFLHRYFFLLRLWGSFLFTASTFTHVYDFPLLSPPFSPRFFPSYRLPYCLFSFCYLFLSVFNFPSFSYLFSIFPYFLLLFHVIFLHFFLFVQLFLLSLFCLLFSFFLIYPFPFKFFLRVFPLSSFFDPFV